MTHKGGRLLSTLVCFLFSYLTAYQQNNNEQDNKRGKNTFHVYRLSFTIPLAILFCTYKTYFLQGQSVSSNLCLQVWLFQYPLVSAGVNPVPLFRTAQKQAESALLQVPSDTCSRLQGYNQRFRLLMLRCPPMLAYRFLYCMGSFRNTSVTLLLYSSS